MVSKSVYCTSYLYWSPVCLLQYHMASGLKIWRDSVTRFSTSGSFMNQFPPSSWVYRKFTEIIAAQRAPPVSLTPVANEKKTSIIKVLIILFGHLWEVELTYRYIFAFKFTLRSHQPDIVPIATGVVETGGKFAAGIVIAVIYSGESALYAALNDHKNWHEKWVSNVGLCVCTRNDVGAVDH